MLYVLFGFCGNNQYDETANEVPARVGERHKPSESIEDEKATHRLAPPRRHQGRVCIRGQMRPNDRSHEASPIKGNEGKEVEATDEDIDPSEIGSNGIRVGTPKGCGEDERADWSGKGHTDFMPWMGEFLVKACPTAEKMQSNVVDRPTTPTGDESMSQLVE